MKSIFQLPPQWALTVEQTRKSGHPQGRTPRTKPDLRIEIDPLAQGSSAGLPHPKAGARTEATAGADIDPPLPTDPGQSIS
jgi:hypothetical protein